MRWDARCIANGESVKRKMRTSNVELSREALSMSRVKIGGFIFASWCRISQRRWRSIGSSLHSSSRISRKRIKTPRDISSRAVWSCLNAPTRGLKILTTNSHDLVIRACAMALSTSRSIFLTETFDVDEEDVVVEEDDDAEADCAMAEASCKSRHAKSTSCSLRDGTGGKG